MAGQVLRDCRVLDTPLDCAAAQAWLAAAGGAAGATVLFTGQVRDEAGAVASLFLEHYPAMTEKSLERIAAEVGGRWPLARVLAWHRVGHMVAGDTIVVVGVAAAHRAEAFEACCCLMDRVKTEVPLWKRVSGAGGDGDWVEARASDVKAARRWREQGEEDEH
ncbi:molybdenum cofactor biosynthesis protein MoaE [Isoalcanivorax indicus]|uniref:molybdenum cofactor biosynthesis protein MoaE n=1 Tax=Isoalcanivorax indicus TaxID=2202653 RepID=UPI000DB90EA6|nr:molybdenum cofactor biosynthesis protein MoaE [Isoalcanivorax indicus]